MGSHLKAAAVTAAVALVVVTAYHKGLLNFVPFLSGAKAG